MIDLLYLHFGNWLADDVIGWTDSDFRISRALPLLASSADEKFMIFPYCSQKTGFDISCKLSPIISIGDNLHEMLNLGFLEKLRKNISICRLLKIFSRAQLFKASLA